MAGGNRSLSESLSESKVSRRTVYTERTMYSAILVVEFLEEYSFGADHEGVEYNRDGWDRRKTDDGNSWLIIDPA